MVFCCARARSRESRSVFVILLGLFTILLLFVGQTFERFHLRGAQTNGVSSDFVGSFSGRDPINSGISLVRYWPREF